MKRRIFNVLAAVSLVMAMAVAGLWARSVWYQDCYTVASEFWWGSISSLGGQVAFATGANDKSNLFPMTYTPPGASFEVEPGCSMEWGNLVDYWAPSAGPIECASYGIRVADWLLIPLFAALPAAWLVKRLRRRCKAVGLCTKCGYDLRASPGPACPECGAAIPATAA